MDTTFKAKHIHRRQTTNLFCSFAEHTASNIFPVLTKPNKKVLITTVLTKRANHFTVSNHPTYPVVNKTCPTPPLTTTSWTKQNTTSSTKQNTTTSWTKLVWHHLATLKHLFKNCMQCHRSWIDKKTYETYRQCTMHHSVKTQTTHSCCSKHSLMLCKW